MMRMIADGFHSKLAALQLDRQRPRLFSPPGQPLFIRYMRTRKYEELVIPYERFSQLDALHHHLHVAGCRTNGGSVSSQRMTTQCQVVRQYVKEGAGQGDFFATIPIRGERTTGEGTFTFSWTDSIDSCALCWSIAIAGYTAWCWDRTPHRVVHIYPSISGTNATRL
jgi:hypothetical protein